MFIYNSNLLQRNIDDTVIRVVVPSGVPIGQNVHKIIYVSSFILSVCSRCYSRKLH